MNNELLKLSKKEAKLDISKSSRWKASLKLLEFKVRIGELFKLSKNFLRAHICSHEAHKIKNLFKIF